VMKFHATIVLEFNARGVATLPQVAPAART
jgi:hypothetical protein